ncbi:hypothetical protein PRIPAC_91466 [Pristionchus pacificus]|uniref:G protein-coupled receptor n=1 Tax=Pristionchus pacificus TaxID=54126 RepID=A0A2A6CGI1_PRIPA|nr:hypothetical protein PRIPAC_91466 [Pristionchus pacificus]|eukprot:PDM77324.1 G protein-coupled receptor [Pristionchus pacificus]
MFLSNFLNRNITDELSPLFEIIYCVEIRFRVIFGVVNAYGFVLARIALLAHQYFGDRNYVVNWYLILATVQKDVFLSYMVILFGVLEGADDDEHRHFSCRASVDSRVISIKIYPGNHTDLFLVILGTEIFSKSRYRRDVVWSQRRLDMKNDDAHRHQHPREPQNCEFQRINIFELCQIPPDLPDSFANGLIYFITNIVTMTFFSVCAIVGIIVYTAIHRHNSRELESTKVRSDTDTYSVSRSRQIKENIALLRLFKKVALPLILCSLPAFGLTFLYVLIPPNIGFDTLRHICVALNDVWLSLSCVLVISRILLLERKIVRYLLRMSIDEKHLPSQETEYEVATKTYFDMLRKEWQ